MAALTGQTRLTRRASTGTVAALAAAVGAVGTGVMGPGLVIAYAAPAGAPDRAAQRAAAVKQAADLRTFRKFQDALDLLAPFAGDKDFDLLIELGRNTEGLTTPADKLRAAEWYTQAIALKPTKKDGFQRRGGAYGDAGYRWFDERLADRQRVVELAEAVAANKTAPAGDYSDLAGAHNAFIATRGGGQVDLERAKQVLDLRSKAIAVSESYGRLLDRAELINSRFNNPGAAREDIDRAIFLVHRRMESGKPGSTYAEGQLKRRVAALPATMTLLGASVSVSGFPTFQLRPSVAQYRAQAIDAYSRYIDAFEQSGRDYATWGDGVGAYENRASTNRSLGGTSHKEAIKDMTTLIGINPRNADYYRLRATSLDAIGERTAARPDYEKYLELNGSEDLGDVGAVRARLAS